MLILHHISETANHTLEAETLTLYSKFILPPDNHLNKHQCFLLTGWMYMTRVSIEKEAHMCTIFSESDGTSIQFWSLHCTLFFPFSHIICYNRASIQKPQIFN